MASVHVGIGHQDDLVIARAADVERVLVLLFVRILPLPSDARPQRHDKRPDFIAGQHLVEPRLFHVQDLALQRKNGLKFPVPSHLRGTACGFALDDEQLAEGRVLLRAVGQFPGERPSVQRALSTDQLLGFPGRVARPGRVDGLADDLAGDGRVLVKIDAQGVVHRRLDEALHFAVPQLGLGLAFELRIAQLDAHDRGEALPHVVPGQRLRVLLQEIVRVGVVIDGPRERRLEPDQMGPALAGIDVVGKGIEILGVGVVVLDGDFQGEIRLFDLHKDRLMEGRLGSVQMLHKGHDAALVPEALFLFLPLTGIPERDAQPLVEEGQLAQTLRQDVETEVDRFEDLPVWLEHDLRATFPGLARDLQGLGRLASLIPLLEDLAVLPDFELQPLGERIHHGNPDTVQSAGNRVGPLFELAPGVQHRQGHLGGRLLLGRMHAGRDAPPVIDHHHASIDLDRHVDRFAEPGHVLVHAVVDHFVDEVMEAVGSRAPDVHGGALADRIQALQDLDLVRVIPF